VKQIDGKMTESSRRPGVLTGRASTRIATAAISQKASGDVLMAAGSDAT
jgi:hypothetical protein